MLVVTITGTVVLARLFSRSDDCHSGPVSTLRVLVVDDSPAFRAAVSSFLGLDDRLDIVDAVESAAAAFDVLSHRRVDLVLLDVTMPERSGTSAAVEMAATYPKLTIVLCSTMSRTDLGIPAHDDSRRVIFIPKDELVPDALIEQWERHLH